MGGGRDTIFALSSGALPAAIAVVRLSGPAADDVAAGMIGRLPPHRRATLRTIRDADGVIDRGLVLRFPEGASATGEALVEFQVHGGVATVERLLGSLARSPGLRHAEPGEFTRRALLNGRISLVEAEALGDLLAARTEAERRWALGAVEGAFGVVLAEVREALLALSARTEALIDYSDEGEVDIAGEKGLRRDLAAFAAKVAEDARRPPSESLRDGVEIVLGGPPNSGKSSLFNALLRREAALVSAHAGTTRDRIEALIVLADRRFKLVDTAGVHDADDPVERMGIERARASARSAAILIWLGDSAPPRDDAVIHVRARCDEAGREGDDGRLGLSSRTGEGLDTLLERIVRIAPAPSEDHVVLTARQARGLAVVADSLGQARKSIDLLIVADCLRAARESLETLAAPADVDAVLDALFGRFCLGK